MVELITAVIGYIIRGIIWGVVVDVVLDSKGIGESWFWWGFFFGVFALLVACVQPKVTTYVPLSASSKSDVPGESSFLRYSNSAQPKGTPVKVAPVVVEPVKIPEGGWLCACGRANAHYVSTCACGVSRYEAENGISHSGTEEKLDVRKTDPTEKQDIQNMDDMDKISAIKGYKELLDSGIITQDEFDAKKKQLLGI